MTGVLIKKGNLDTEMIQIKGKQCEETQRKDVHLQPKERVLKQILLSQPLDGTRLADTLILDLDSLELEDHKFLLLKAPTLSQWPWKTNIWY